MPTSRVIRAMIPFPGGCFVGLLVLLFSVLASNARGAVAIEYEVKAVFLFNFATFVQWPAHDEYEIESPPPFVIGILGEDPFGAVLDQVVAQEYVGDRPMVVRRLKNVEDVASCQILFIARSEARRLGDVLRSIRGRSVLTVADTPGFAEAGGMIGFSTDQGRVRLSINTAVIDAARLTVSTKLLRLARVVKTTARR